jgi:anti-anti-sigma regulatory factor
MPDMAQHGLSLDTSFTRPTAFVTLSYKGGILTAVMKGPSIGEREASVIAAELGRTLNEVGARLRVLVLDLRDVQVMTSMGLGMCIDARNSAALTGAETVAYGLCRKLAELFRMMKVDRLYRMAGTEVELSSLLAA